MLLIRLYGEYYCCQPFRMGWIVMAMYASTGFRGAS